MYRQSGFTRSCQAGPHGQTGPRPGVPWAMVAIVALLCGATGCRSGPTHSGGLRVQDNGGAALDSIETALTHLHAAMIDTAPGSQPRTCRSGGGAWVLASDYDGRTYDCPAGAEDGTGDVFHGVLLALTEDWTPLLATLKQMMPEPGGIWRRPERGPDSYHLWRRWYRPMLAETVDHVEWIMAELRAAHELRLEYNGRGWGGAVLHYERALHGTYVMVVWLCWLDFAHRASQAMVAMQGSPPQAGAFRFYERVQAQGDKVAPVLSRLRDEPRMRFAETAKLVQSKLLPEWGRGLYEWGKEVQERLGDAADSARTREVVMTVVETVLLFVATRGMIRWIPVRRNPLSFVLPGIGRVMAGGGATGVRVVISAERVTALQQLIAIGAVTGVAALNIAMTHSAAGAPPDAPEPSMKVLVKHKAGNRQVEIYGQRWHLPKGKTKWDIPRLDPIGDKLQAAVTRAARRWQPSYIKPGERDAINKFRANGQIRKAELQVSSSRGRWVEQEVENEFRPLRKRLKFNRRGVDVVDRYTGLKYEICAGSKTSLNHHCRRMATELFRMLTFD